MTVCTNEDMKFNLPRSTKSQPHGNAMLFAAGKGTRLRPITNEMPKALVPLAGQPMIDYILLKLKNNDFKNIVVNVHHFASQIVEHLKGTGVKVSLEEELLDTGGGLKRALPLFGNDEPVLVHNVDILSNVDLRTFYNNMKDEDVTLLVSKRQTKRYILFDDEMRMIGWTNTETGEVRSPYKNIDIKTCNKYAFSGIHIISQRISTLMNQWPDRFPIIDFYIQNCKTLNIKGVIQGDLHLIDVGKIDNLRQAETFLMQHKP